MVPDLEHLLEVQSGSRTMRIGPACQVLKQVLKQVQSSVSLTSRAGGLRKKLTQGQMIGIGLRAREP